MDEENGLAQRIALIRYYLKEDPKTFQEFATLWGQLSFALQFDGKLKVTEIRKG